MISRRYKTKSRISTGGIKLNKGFPRGIKLNQGYLGGIKLNQGSPRE